MVFKCKHEDCTNVKHEGLGYCRKHYVQFKRLGKTLKTSQKDFNEIIDTGGKSVKLVLIDLNGDKVGEALIDREDLPKAKLIGRWSLTKEGYVRNSLTRTMLHRLVINAKEGERVDHVKTGFKSKSDNRKKNLRLCTQSQNLYNTERYKSNTSGFKGVHWNKRDKKWTTYITVDKKRKHLENFNSLEEASKVYEKAAKTLHKDFYYKNK